MRIHGIHLQGIRAPQGEQRLTFDPGYNVVLARSPEDARALVRVVEALLYPDGDLRDLEVWTSPERDRPARVGLSLSLGADAYRVILDVEARRVVLGRFDAESEAYERVATDRAEIARRLVASGLPTREGFASLLLYAPLAGEPDAAAGAIALPEPPPDPEATAGERAADEARVPELRRAREHLLELEREQKRVGEELERRAALEAGIDGDLHAQLRRFRELCQVRDHEIGRVGSARLALIEDRSRLRAVPAGQARGMWLGVLLGSAAVLGGAWVQPGLYFFGLLGVATAGVALWRSRRARRRLGAIEARLAALRVRETSAERQFELETARLRELVRVLRLDSIEELEAEVDRYRELVERAETVRRELEEARRAFPGEAEAELRKLEAQRAARSEARAPSPPGLRVPVSAPVAAPEELVRAAGGASGQPEPEIRERVRPLLPLYLRALTAGAYTRARYREGEGWLFRREGWSDRVSFQRASQRDRPRLALAFQLALLEALAPVARLSLIVGPDLPFRGADERDVLARALKRLGSAAQVIQCAADEAWSAPASALHRLSG